MSTSGDGPSGPEDIKPKPARRPQTNVRTLIVLVGCVGVILWSWRRLSEDRDPTIVEARAIQKRAIGALNSTKAAERLAAIQDLERLGFGDSALSIRPVIGTLSDEDTAIRTAAAEALGRLVSNAIRDSSDPEAIRAGTIALIGSLKDPNPEVRLESARSLGTLNSAMPRGPAGPPLPRGKKAAAPPAPAPVPAVKLVSLVDKTTVLNALIEAINDKDAKVRGAVLAALGSVNSDSSVDPPKAFAVGLEDESPENRRMTVFSLISFRQGLDPWIPSLLRIAEHDPDRSVREACMNFLGGALKPPAVTAAAVPALIAGLGSNDAKLRIQVAGLLGRIGPDAWAAIPSLLRVLNEPLDPKLTRPESGYMIETDDPANAAALALPQIARGSTASKAVIAALTEVVRAGLPIRRGYAAYALGEIGPDAAEAVPVLIKLLKDNTPHTPTRNNHSEVSVAHSLGQIAPGTTWADQAVTALMAVLESDWSDSRALAIKALGKFGPKAAVAIPKVRALLNDKERFVKDAAVATLPGLEHESESKP